MALKSVLRWNGEVGLFTLGLSAAVKWGRSDYVMLLAVTGRSEGFGDEAANVSLKYTNIQSYLNAVVDGGIAMLQKLLLTQQPCAKIGTHRLQPAIAGSIPVT